MQVHWDVFQQGFLKDVSAQYISVETLSALAFIRLREKHDPGKVIEWRQSPIKKYAHYAAWKSQHYFFQHYLPRAKSISILSFQYFTSLSYFSPCSLWCEIPSFTFLMFRDWKCAEDWAEAAAVVRQHHALRRSANEQVEGVSLPGSLLRWDKTFLCCYTASSFKIYEKSCGNVRWVPQIF